MINVQGLICVSTCLLHSRAYNFYTTKVHVFSDSCALSEKIGRQSCWILEGQVPWYSDNNYFSEMNRIDGQPVQFEWKIFPLCTTVWFFQSVFNDDGRKKREPENFTSNIKRSQNNEEVSWKIPSLSLVFPGAWMWKEVAQNLRSKNQLVLGTTAEEMLLNFSGSGHPIFRRTNAFGKRMSRGVHDGKRHMKNSRMDATEIRLTCDSLAKTPELIRSLRESSHSMTKSNGRSSRRWRVLCACRDCTAQNVLSRWILRSCFSWCDWALRHSTKSTWSPASWWQLWSVGRKPKISWWIHHEGALSSAHRIQVVQGTQTSAQLPGIDPGHANGVEPGGIGKAQSAKASSMLLIVLVARIAKQHRWSHQQRSPFSSYWTEWKTAGTTRSEGAGTSSGSMISGVPAGSALCCTTHLLNAHELIDAVASRYGCQDDGETWDAFPPPSESLCFERRNRSSRASERNMVPTRFHIRHQTLYEANGQKLLSANPSMSIPRLRTVVFKAMLQFLNWGVGGMENILPTPLHRVPGNCHHIEFTWASSEFTSRPSSLHITKRGVANTRQIRNTLQIRKRHRTIKM